MNIELHVREYRSADEMLAFYADLKRRRKFAPEPPAPPPVKERKGRRIYQHSIGPVRLRDVFNVATPDLATRPRPARQIIAYVMIKHGATMQDIKSARRPQKLVNIRHEIFYRLKQETSLSLPQIGRLLGGKDHTTVLHGIRRYENMIQMGLATYEPTP